MYMHMCIYKYYASIILVCSGFFFKIRQNFCKAENYFGPYQTYIMELFFANS